MRAFLTRISPLTNAAKITKPLFVVQGKNDPRVPYTEAEQIVAKARANGTPVWYLRAENEGHGFARKENADFQFYAIGDVHARDAAAVALGPVDRARRPRRAAGPSNDALPSIREKVPARVHMQQGLSAFANKY